ncbi:MAG: TIM barrel protein [Chloroflexi bacterium]|nr:TIM barrel protein [Chloroflexota bacterium]
MILGFNPLLTPVNRRSFTNQLKAAIQTARTGGFRTLEITCTESMFDLGLTTVFGGEFLETLIATQDLRVHLHLFYGDHSLEEIAISDTFAPTRAAYLRRLVQIVEFFERNRSIQLYVVHTGPRTLPLSEHLGALATSLDVMRTLYPHLTIAVENGRRGSVIETPHDILSLLERHPEIPLVFDTGLAFQAVGFQRHVYTELLRALQRFDRQIVEVHWNNTAPGYQPNRPLHVPLEGGIDIDLVARQLGHNPRATHLIETMSTRDSEALIRDQRALYRALSAA